MEPAWHAGSEVCSSSPGFQAFTIIRRLAGCSRMRRIVSRSWSMRLPLDLSPLLLIERREECVARGLGVDFGHIDAIGVGQEIPEHACAPEHDDLGDVAGERERLLGRARDEATITAEIGIAREHDAHAIREWPADRIEGAPPHDQWLAHGQLADVPHVIGKPPGEPSVLADNPVAIAGHDECDAAQTAIFALMGGWYW